MLLFACGAVEPSSEASIDFLISESGTSYHLELRSTLDQSELDKDLQNTQRELQNFFERLESPKSPEDLAILEGQIRRHWGRRLQLTAATLVVNSPVEEVPESVNETIRELPGTLGYQE